MYFFYRWGRCQPSGRARVRMRMVSWHSWAEWWPTYLWICTWGRWLCWAMFLDVWKRLLSLVGTTAYLLLLGFIVQAQIVQVFFYSQLPHILWRTSSPFHRCSSSRVSGEPPSPRVCFQSLFSSRTLESLSSQHNHNYTSRPNFVQLLEVNKKI